MAGRCLIESPGPGPSRAESEMTQRLSAAVSSISSRTLNTRPPPPPTVCTKHTRPPSDGWRVCVDGVRQTAGGVRRRSGRTAVGPRTELTERPRAGRLGLTAAEPGRHYSAGNESDAQPRPAAPNSHLTKPSGPEERRSAARAGYDWVMTSASITARRCV